MLDLLKRFTYYPCEGQFRPFLKCRLNEEFSTEDSGPQHFPPLAALCPLSMQFYGLVYFLHTLIEEYEFTFESVCLETSTNSRALPGWSAG